MIQFSRSNSQIDCWQKELAEAIKNPSDLLKLLDLPSSLLSAALTASKKFPLKATRDYISRIKPGDPEDPLLLQILPIHAELSKIPGFTTDPVGDMAASVIPGLLHKYHGRVLLTATGACAIHCRYCFRRHYPYNQNNPTANNWSPALKYIANDVSIAEVILSGGDPLMLSDQRLMEIGQKLAQIKHIKTLRIHTRLPIVVPKRVTNSLLQLLTNSDYRSIIVIHTNHKNEINDAVSSALAKIRRAGICVLNQTVLLRKINDSAQTLIDLNNRLFEFGVLPYYLHLLDPVEGAAHFNVTIDDAKQLIDNLRQHLPGYLVPRLAQEEAGFASKTIIA